MEAFNSSGSIQLAINGRTDIGQIRNENEDSIRWLVHPQHPFGYVVIADGMGGYTGGAMASSIAVETLKHYLDNIISPTFLAGTADQQELMIQAALVDAITIANQEILNAKVTRPQLAQMGTTLVVAAVWQDRVLIAHLGDSRAYLWDQHGVMPLTRDHSLVQEMIESGSLTPEQAKTCDVRNHITRALGVTPAVEPSISSFQLQHNCLLMLCSDGLTEYLNDNDLEYVLSTHRPALECCYRFIDDANHLGGKDNISVGIIEFTMPQHDEAGGSDFIATPELDTQRDITVRKEQRNP